MYTSCRDRADQAYINSRYDDEADTEDQIEEALEDTLAECAAGNGTSVLDFFSDACCDIEPQILQLLSSTYRPNPQDEAIGKQVYALLSKAFAKAVEEHADHVVLWSK